MSEVEKSAVRAQKNRIPLFAGIGAIALVAVIVVAVLVARGGSSSRKLREQLDLGRQYLSELNYEQAIAAFDAALAIDPKAVEAYDGLISAYAALGDADGLAETASRAMANLDGSDADRIAETAERELERLANAALQSGDYDESLRIVTRLESLNAQSAASIREEVEAARKRAEEESAAAESGNDTNVASGEENLGEDESGGVDAIELSEWYGRSLEEAAEELGLEPILTMGQFEPGYSDTHYGNSLVGVASDDGDEWIDGVLLETVEIGGYYVGGYTMFGISLEEDYYSACARLENLGYVDEIAGVDGIFDPSWEAGAYYIKDGMAVYIHGGWGYGMEGTGNPVVDAVQYAVYDPDYFGWALR